MTEPTSTVEAMQVAIDAHLFRVFPWTSPDQHRRKLSGELAAVAWQAQARWVVERGGGERGEVYAARMAVVAAADAFVGDLTESENPSAPLTALALAVLDLRRELKVPRD